MAVVSVQKFDFVGNDGTPVKFNKVFVQDSEGAVGSLNTQRDVKAGDLVEPVIYVRRDGSFGVRL